MVDLKLTGVKTTLNTQLASMAVQGCGGSSTTPGTSALLTSGPPGLVREDRLHHGVPDGHSHLPIDLDGCMAHLITVGERPESPRLKGSCEVG